MGGTVEVLLEPTNSEDFKKSLHYIGSYPVVWLGLGSNVLFEDGCLPAVVIKTKKALNKLTVTQEGMYAQAGVSCAKLSRSAIANGFEDLAFFAGVPGTVGGALSMNAGAFQGETWEFVTAVEWLWPDGSVDILTPEQFNVGYRHVVKPDEGCFWGAWFQSKKGSPSSGKSKIKTLLQQRQLTQPIGKFSCGSVFKNPDGMHAAQLIESCGLKGLSIGGAQISQLHANFIINNNHALCSDILELVETIKERVYSEFSVVLEPEFHLLSEDTL